MAEPEARRDGEGDWLRHVTQIVGLFAGLATLVYLTGGVVMALRLLFVQLPWDNVVSQLPREFLISIGAGQVLFPALLVGVLYGLFRLLRADRAQPPELSRWRVGGRARGQAVKGYALTLAVMIIPPLVVLFPRFAWGGLGFDSALLVVGGAVIVMAGAAIAVHETRAVVMDHYRAPRRWNGVRAIVTIAAIYAAAAVPSMMAAAASVPLTSVRVCDVDNFSEHGFLVGEAGDRVYIGEEGKARRIAVIPMTKVAELFIGDDAPYAHCEIVSGPLTPDERRVIEKREDSDRSHSFLTP